MIVAARRSDQRLLTDRRPAAPGRHDQRDAGLRGAKIELQRRTGIENADAGAQGDPLLSRHGRQLRLLIYAGRAGDMQPVGFVAARDKTERAPALPDRLHFGDLDAVTIHQRAFELERLSGGVAGGEVNAVLQALGKLAAFGKEFDFDLARFQRAVVF